ncbi:hypothetical protein EIP91_003122 [Steccherinum ochraceum]|uniref:Phosphatidate phosphatase APP1 catalytic domain-containing protein n=1 Tax=Steccherinum ochraceum TaxID=92696 RepID=A0A4R0RZA0_9APHY|nr:hypothetical protein EIP91_003122 [Steccherinum ochraceum]
MPEEMSWRSLASAAGRSIKGYVAQRDPRKVVVVATEQAPQNGSLTTTTYLKQSWGQWAGQKIRDIRQPNDEALANTVEKLSLFPGWAARRYRKPSQQDVENEEFNIEVFVSGFASKFSGPGFGTRGGKAFLRIAKTYAALPKLVNGLAVASEPNSDVDDRLTQTADELIATKHHLPPRPDEMTEDAEIKALEEKLQQLEDESESEPAESSGASASSESSHHSSGDSSQTHSAQSDSPPSVSGTNLLQKWHANLEQRLYPFWATALSNRTLRIAIYSSDPSLYDSVTSPPLHAPNDDEHALHRRPIATKEVTTNPDGSFQARFVLDWETICQHPGALHIAFGDSGLEHELFVSTQLMPAPSRPSTPTSAGSGGPGAGSSQYFTRPPRIPRPTVTATLSVPLTHTTVRVISDIDDTVKLSGVVQGARTAFRNVFVKDLGESIIPGMADWYLAMWRRGVRFHYVSNGPFELLPIVNEFIQLSRLPPGSVKLKSYAGRSLFNGILAAPAERKRAGIIDVLDSFPDSRFILVGDSGEQDMELYAQMARERPTQIIAIFIRDANNVDIVPPLDDPTGEQVLRCSADEVPIIGGSGSGRSPLSVIIPSKPGSAAPTPSSSPRLADANFMTPRPKQSSRSISELNTPKAGTGTGGTVTPRSMRKPMRSKSEQIPDAATVVRTNGSSDSSPGSSASTAVSRRSSPSPPKLLPPRLNLSQDSRLSASSSSTLADSPISEEPGMIFTPTPSRPVPVPIPSPARPSSYFTRTPSRSSTISSMMGVGGGLPAMSEAEKKQFDLQTRVYRARVEAPKHVPLRVFRSPEECVEAAEALDRLHLGAGSSS